MRVFKLFNFIIIALVMLLLSGCYVGGGDSENDNTLAFDPGEFDCSETITCSFDADGELSATQNCSGNPLFPVDIETLSNEEINACIDAAVDAEESENEAEAEIAETSLEDFFSLEEQELVGA